MKKYIFALLTLLALLTAVTAVAEEEEAMDWYLYWKEEIGVDIGTHRPDVQKKFGVDNYVSESGVTSAIIEGEDIVWLREETGGQSLWYGLDNSQGALDLGARFSVEWMDEGSKAWKNTYNQLDDRHKAASDHEYVFDVGIMSPGNEPYTDLKQPVKLYVQLGDEWDKKNLKAAYIAGGADEDVSVETQVLRYPAGKDSFAVMQLEHFSP